MKMKAWPVCPECDARRVAVCRFCKTQGDDFPLAKMEYLVPHDPTPEAPPVADDGIIVRPILAGTLGVAYADTLRLEPIPPVVGGAADAPSCHSGSGECATHQGNSCAKGRETLKLTDPLDAVPEYNPDAGEQYPLMVMCPDCGELIAPRFLNTCRQCRHTFPDGLQLRANHDDVSDEGTARVFWTMLAILGVLGLLGFVLFLSTQ